MSFKMLDDLSIIGRRGDSASFTFEFEDDIKDYEFIFQVKKNITDNDEIALIRKTFKDLQENAITVELTPEDTLKLTTQGMGYSTYCWGIKAYLGEDYAQTLIPKDNTPAPKFSVLPAIIEEQTAND